MDTVNVGTREVSIGEMLAELEAEIERLESLIEKTESRRGEDVA